MTPASEASESSDAFGKFEVDNQIRIIKEVLTPSEGWSSTEVESID